MTTTFTYQGRKFELHTYVDPHPGMNGRDRVQWWDTCSRCGGSGIYTWHNQMGKCQGSCFGCWGTGKVERDNAVQTLRQNAKLDALFAEYGDQFRAEREAEAAARRAADEAAEFERAWDEAHAEQARRAALVTGFVAPVGDKVKNLRGVVKFEKTISTDFGSSKLLIVTLEDGHEVKTFGSSLTLWGHERGDELVILSATVKAHESYNGQDQTVLQRVKVDDFDRRASQVWAYEGHRPADEVEAIAVERGYVKKNELPRLREWIAKTKADAEKD